MYTFEHSNTNYVSHRNTVAFLALSETVGAFCSISAEAKETENLTTQRRSTRAIESTEAKRQILKTTGQVHSLQALVQFMAKCQILKTAWQVHSLQGLAKSIPCVFAKHLLEIKGGAFIKFVKPYAKSRKGNTRWENGWYI